MLLDVIQLTALAAIVVGIWVALLASSGVGVAVILTGLIVLGAALAVEHRTA